MNNSGAKRISLQMRILKILIDLTAYFIMLKNTTLTEEESPLIRLTQIYST